MLIEVKLSYVLSGNKLISVKIPTKCSLIKKFVLPLHQHSESPFCQIHILKIYTHMNERTIEQNQLLGFRFLSSGESFSRELFPLSPTPLPKEFFDGLGIYIFYRIRQLVIMTGHYLLSVQSPIRIIVRVAEEHGMKNSKVLSIRLAGRPNGTNHHLAPLRTLIEFCSFFGVGYREFFNMVCDGAELFVGNGNAWNYDKYCVQMSWDDDEEEIKALKAEMEKDRETIKRLKQTTKIC